MLYNEDTFIRWNDRHTGEHTCNLNLVLVVWDMYDNIMQGWAENHPKNEFNRRLTNVINNFTPLQLEVAKDYH